MGKNLKQHLKPYIEDCKAYMAQLRMFENLKVGTWLSGGFGDRKDIYGLVTYIKHTKTEIVIDIDFYDVRNRLERFNWTTLTVSKTYSPQWTFIGNSPYKISEFKVIKNKKMFLLLYGPKV